MEDGLRRRRDGMTARIIFPLPSAGEGCQGGGTDREQPTLSLTQAALPYSVTVLDPGFHRDDSIPFFLSKNQWSDALWYKNKLYLQLTVQFSRIPSVVILRGVWFTAKVGTEIPGLR
jgi:hypothetical protein